MLLNDARLHGWAIPGGLCYSGRGAMRNPEPAPVRILAVDDEQDVLGFYQAVFCPWQSPSDTDAPLPSAEESAGSCTAIDLSVCAQGGEAVEAVQAAVEGRRPFAVAFLDLRMPPGAASMVSGTLCRI